MTPLAILIAVSGAGDTSTEGTAVRGGEPDERAGPLPPEGEAAMEPSDGGGVRPSEGEADGVPGAPDVVGDPVAVGDG